MRVQEPDLYFITLPWHILQLSTPADQGFTETEVVPLILKV